MDLRAGLVACLALGALLGAPVAAQERKEGPSPGLRIVTDQADAALLLLDRRARGEEVREEDWRRLLDSEGYRRLEKRQRSFGQTDFEARLRAFLESEEALARRAALHATVSDWHDLDLAAAAARALAYLPAGSALRATIYPVIKHTSNSFVFELDTDPAIFLYVDPELPAAKLANTLAHELHHVGSSLDCPRPDGYEELSADVRTAIDWLSGFGEGLAMLAAAGGPDVDPHAASGEAERAVWRRDLAKFAADVERLEAFFLAVATGQLDDEERRRRGFTFINTDDVPQGAFYTVGWRMAAEIERAMGRGPVVAAICDPRILLTAYNQVARAAGGESGRIRWSTELIERLYGKTPEH